MHRYQNADVLVTWDKAVCTHAGECVRGLPAVFNIRKTPWVNVDAATAEQIEAAIARCPSGALRFTRRGEQA